MSKITDHRRKSDAEQYKRMATERLQQELEAEERAGQKLPTIKREYLRQRDYKVDIDSKHGKRVLTNDDFRRLLIAPRSTLAATPTAQARTPESNDVKETTPNIKDDLGEGRRKKKIINNKLRIQVENKLAELGLIKYRDRAKERRDGTNADSQVDDPMSTSSGYRAVAHDLKSGIDATERRPASTPTAQTPTPENNDGKKTTPNIKRERRRKKKIIYNKVKKQVENKLAELGQKYRDRAKERRDGTNADYQVDDPISTSSGYRAVAHDLKSGIDAAERRRQMIEESKFLGGDMEHTHLVKGLDYALLQKIRSEIRKKELEQEEEMEKLVAKPKTEKKTKEEEEMVFKTRLGRNIYKVALGNTDIERNALFAQGRIAYVFDLKDKMADSDIPTTLLRSIADVPAQESLTTNDIVINKVAEIFSYLRQGPRHKESKKPGNVVSIKLHCFQAEEGIFPDDRDYADNVPSINKQNDNRMKMSNYFKHTEKAPIPPSNTKYKKTVQSCTKKKSRAAKPIGYAECYPGFDKIQDALDYTKMDQGNKIKRVVGSFDFDTQEKHSHYMNTKEALPKAAAFQYGFKMANGRRTRNLNKEKTERAELDREWNKIKFVIQKRKAPDGSALAETRQFKIRRY